MVRERGSEDRSSTSLDLTSSSNSEGEWPNVWAERRQADQGVDVPAMGSLPLAVPFEPREVLEQVTPAQRLLEEELDLLSSSVPSSPERGSGGSLSSMEHRNDPVHPWFVSYPYGRSEFDMSFVRIGDTNYMRGFAVEHPDYFRVLRSYVDERLAAGLAAWDDTVVVAPPPARYVAAMADAELSDLRHIEVSDRPSSRNMESSGSSERVPVLPRLTPSQQERRRRQRARMAVTRREARREHRRVQAEILARNEAADAGELHTAPTENLSRLPGYQRWGGARMQQALEVVDARPVDGRYELTVEQARRVQDIMRGMGEEVPEMDEEGGIVSFVVGPDDVDAPPEYTAVCPPVLSQCADNRCRVVRRPRVGRQTMDGYPIEFDALLNLESAMCPTMVMRVHCQPRPWAFAAEGDLERDAYRARHLPMLNLCSSTNYFLSYDTLSPYVRFRVVIVSDVHPAVEQIPGGIFKMQHLARFMYEGRLGREIQVILGRLSTVAYSGLYDAVHPIVNRVINTEAEFDYIFCGTKLYDQLYPLFKQRLHSPNGERKLTVGLMTGQPVAAVAARPVTDLYIAGMTIGRLWQVAQYDPTFEEQSEE